MATFPCGYNEVEAVTFPAVSGTVQVAGSYGYIPLNLPYNVTLKSPTLYLINVSLTDSPYKTTSLIVANSVFSGGQTRVIGPLIRGQFQGIGPNVPPTSFKTWDDITNNGGWPVSLPFSVLLPSSNNGKAFTYRVTQVF